jgi:hypothetical protein
VRSLKSDVLAQGGHPVQRKVAAIRDSSHLTENATGVVSGNRATSTAVPGDRHSTVKSSNSATRLQTSRKVNRQHSKISIGKHQISQVSKPHRTVRRTMTSAQAVRTHHIGSSIH